MESVLARLRLRMAGLKCLALSGDEDRLLVDAAVQEAQQQGATVGPRSPSVINIPACLFSEFPFFIYCFISVDPVLHTALFGCPVPSHSAL